MSDLKAYALALYKPPFQHLHGYILDSDNRVVADDGEATKMLGQIAARVRGWGRIKYLPSPEELQDKVGELVAEALTQYWERQCQPAAPQVSDAMISAFAEAFANAPRKEYYEDIRIALEAALAQPGDILAITAHVEDTSGSGLVIKPGEGE